MAVRSEFYIYLAEGKFFPIWIDDDPLRPGTGAVAAYKIVGAPNPPTNTLLRAYSNSVTKHSATFEGEGFMLAACTTTLAEKFIWEPKTTEPFADLIRPGFPTIITTDPEIPGQAIIIVPGGAVPGELLSNPVTFTARREFSVGTPWVVTAIGLAFQFIRSICTDDNFIEQNPRLHPGARQSIISGPVTFTLGDNSAQTLLRGEGETREVTEHNFGPNEIRQLEIVGAFPIFNTPRMFSKVARLSPRWLLAPVGTVPMRQTQRPGPFGKAGEPVPPKPCFDPLTLEEVDCGSGKPKDRDPCSDPFIRVPTDDDVFSLRPRPDLPWKKITQPDGSPRS